MQSTMVNGPAARLASVVPRLSADAERTTLYLLLALVPTAVLLFALRRKTPSGPKFPIWLPIEIALARYAVATGGWSRRI